MHNVAGSFRDPSGYVFEHENTIYRTINTCYSDTWEEMKTNGLLQKALTNGLILDYEECQKEDPIFTHFTENNYKTILKVEKLSFISYPYEWCFSQLKDAALLTLKLHRLALEHAYILKDASAYNVQFEQGKPVFIDLLSFEPWQEGQAWQAYGQFCSHFLAPLALMAKKDLRLGLLSQKWVQGIPLDLASKILPKSTYFNLGIYMHIHLHASMQNKHADGREAAHKVKDIHLSMQKMIDITDSLESVIQKLSLPKQNTEWGNYYEDTNYTETAKLAKINAVKNCAEKYHAKNALDLGANNGFFSKELCQHFEHVIASDIDPLAVEYNYIAPPPHNMLPLILDFANPSTGCGYAGIERDSFAKRCSVDMILALTLCHHLVMTAGLPFRQIASYMAELLNENGVIVIEFIPKEDSQVQRLMAARDDIFTDYSKENFIHAFEQENFQLIDEISFPESLRSLLVFQMKLNKD